MSLYLWIFIGNGPRELARFALSRLIAHRRDETFLGFITTLTVLEGRFRIGSSVRRDDWARDGRRAVGAFAICFPAVWLDRLCAAWHPALKGS